jgi:hypothetical protein
MHTGMVIFINVMPTLSAEPRIASAGPRQSTRDLHSCTRYRGLSRTLIGCRVCQKRVLSLGARCRSTPPWDIQEQVGTRVVLGKGCPSVSCSSRCGGRRVPVERVSGVLLACSLLQSTASLFLGSNGELRAGTGQPSGGIQAWGPTTNNRNGRRVRQLHAVVRGCLAVWLSGSTPTLFHRGPVFYRHDAAAAGRCDGSAVAEGSPRFPASAIAAYPPEPLTRNRGAPAWPARVGPPRAHSRNTCQAASGAGLLNRTWFAAIKRVRLRPPVRLAMRTLEWQAPRQMTDNGLWEQPRGRARAAADRRQ